MAENDLVSLEHDDDSWLCDEDCVSDEEHALVVVPGPVADVVPGPVAEATSAVVQQHEQCRTIFEHCLACRLVYGRGPSVKGYYEAKAKNTISLQLTSHTPRVFLSTFQLYAHFDKTTKYVTS